MKCRAVILGAGLAVVAGWIAGYYGPSAKPAPMPIPAIDREGAARLVLPMDLKSPEALSWASNLNSPMILGLIERESSASLHERRQDNAMSLLLGVLFERDGELAANQWLLVESVCQPQISADFNAWAERDPQQAAAWVERCSGELSRFRGGRLVVDCSASVIRKYAAQDLAAATRLVMEKPAFFDQECLFSLLMSGDWTARELPLLKQLAVWVKERGDDPRHAFSTLSGERLDPRGNAIRQLAGLDPAAARALLGELSADDARRKIWEAEVGPILRHSGQ